MEKIEIRFFSKKKKCLHINRLDLHLLFGCIFITFTHFPPYVCRYIIDILKVCEYIFCISARTTWHDISYLFARLNVQSSLCPCNIEDDGSHGYGHVRNQIKTPVLYLLTQTMLEDLWMADEWGLKFFSWSMKPGFGHDAGLDDFTCENASSNDWPSLHIRYPMTTETDRDTPVLQWTRTTPFC